MKNEELGDYYKSPEVEQLKQVIIEVKPLNWNTYDFTFRTNVQEIQADKLNFEWDFGDGNKSEINGSHKFSGTGDHYVKLKVSGPWGNYLLDSETVTVEFWSVYNYWIWLFILALILLLAAIFVPSGRKGSAPAVQLKENSGGKK